MDIYTVIFLALAVFIFLRLRSVLGQRTGSGFAYRLSMVAAGLCVVHYVAYETKWYSALIAFWRRMNIDWHDPDLYASLALLSGITALVAIIHEFRARKRGRWMKAKPLDGLLVDRSRPTEEKHAMEEIDEGSRRAGWWKKAKPLDGLLRDHPSQRKADDPGRRLTPSEIARLEQDSRTRL